MQNLAMAQAPATRMVALQNLDQLSDLQDMMNGTNLSPEFRKFLEAQIVSLGGVTVKDDVPASNDPVIITDDESILFERFTKAVDMVKAYLNGNKSDPLYFQFDSYYNQAVTGDINYKRPNRVTMIWNDTRKWDAWNLLRGMPQEIAMRKYISLAQSTLDKPVLLMLLI